MNKLSAQRAPVWIACAVALVTSIGMASARAAPPSGSPQPLHDYQAVVKEYARQARSGKRISPRAAQTLEARFAAASSVQMPDGTIVPVSNAQEIQALHRIRTTHGGAELDENARDRAAGLATLVIATGRPVALPNPATTIRAVLKRSEFDFGPKRDDPDESWMKRWVAAFNRSLQRFVDWLSRQHGTPNPKVGDMSGVAEFVKFFFFTVLIVLVAAAIGYFGLKYFQNRGQILPRRRGVALRALDLSPEENADPLGAAHRLAEHGDYRGAIRLAYIAALRHLADDGLLVMEANRTNWEYQRDLLSRSATAYAILLPATRLFDLVWYGSRGGSPAEFQAVIHAYDALAGTPAAGDTSSAAATAAGSDR